MRYDHFTMLPIGAFRSLGRRMTLHGGGKNDAPDPPNYKAAAEEQAASSRESLAQQTWANRPTVNTPWGKQSWQSSANIDPATGLPVTQWEQNITLSPSQQAALDQQQSMQTQRSELAGSFMDRVKSDYAQPSDWSKLPEQAQAADQTTQTTNEAAFGSERQRIEEAMFQKMAPEHQRQEEATRTRLANMGMTMGSQGYNRELERLSGNQAGERWNALQAGGQEQARMQQMLLSQQQQAFGQDTSQADQQSRLRQQAIAEEAQRRGLSLNEMNAMLTGQQVAMPQMPNTPNNTAGNAGGTNYLGAAQSQGQYGLDATNMNNQAAGSFWSGAGALAGTGARMYGMG